MNPELNIAIPIYEYSGKGVEVLNFSLNQMLQQTFQKFEIIISDHSVDDEIENVCKRWSNYFDLKYYRNENDRGSGAANFNNCLKHCTGKIIKLLCADDFVFNKDSLQIVYENFTDDTDLLATAYYHTRDRRNYYNPHYPQMNDMIKVNNTLGTPSCISIRNYDDMPEFDKNLKYCFDEDFYHAYMSKYNRIKLVNSIGIANYIWDASITATIDNELIKSESEYILKKYANTNS